MSLRLGLVEIRCVAHVCLWMRMLPAVAPATDSGKGGWVIKLSCSHVAFVGPFRLDPMFGAGVLLEFAH